MLKTHLLTRLRACGHWSSFSLSLALSLPGTKQDVQRERRGGGGVEFRVRTSATHTCPVHPVSAYKNTYTGTHKDMYKGAYEDTRMLNSCCVRKLACVRGDWVGFCAICVRVFHAAVDPRNPCARTVLPRL